MMKTIWIILLSLCVGALLSTTLTKSRQPQSVTEIVTTDTITVVRHDTIIIAQPKPYKVVVRDTIVITEAQVGASLCQEVKEYKDSTYYARVSGINAYLEENYKKNISLEDVSNHLGLTKSYFCRYFKNITGTSFWNYYTLFRLEKAIELIKNVENENLISIALECGFNNVRSFNKAFKEYYLKTPSEYKKNNSLFS